MTPPRESNTRLSWTQPLCDDCWPKWTGRPVSEQEAIRAVGETETCCHCGARTISGIYVRVDPGGRFCQHPTLTT